MWKNVEKNTHTQRERSIGKYNELPESIAKDGMSMKKNEQRKLLAVYFACFRAHLKWNMSFIYIYRWKKLLLVAIYWYVNFPQVFWVSFTALQWIGFVRSGLLFLHTLCLLHSFLAFSYSLCHFYFFNFLFRHSPYRYVLPILQSCVLIPVGFRECVKKVLSFVEKYRPIHQKRKKKNKTHTNSVKRRAKNDIDAKHWNDYNPVDATSNEVSIFWEEITKKPKGKK